MQSGIFADFRHPVGNAFPVVRRVSRRAVNLSQDDASGADGDMSLDDQLEQLGEQLVAATEPDEINQLAAKFIDLQNTIKSQAGATDDGGQPDDDEPIVVTHSLGMSARRRVVASLESDLRKLDSQRIPQNAPQRSRLKHQLSLARKDLVGFQASRKISASQTATADPADDANAVDLTRPAKNDTLAITSMRRQLAGVEAQLSGMAAAQIPESSPRWAPLQQRQQELREEIAVAVAMNKHHSTIDPRLLPKEPGSDAVTASHRAAKSRGLVANAERRAEAARNSRR